MSNDDLSEEDYTAKLICLAEQCPIGRKNAECPLNAAREMPFGEKVQWVGSLSTQEKKEIYRYHVTCFSKKGACRACEEREKEKET